MRSVLKQLSYTTFAFLPAAVKHLQLESRDCSLRKNLSPLALTLFYQKCIKLAITV